MAAEKDKDPKGACRRGTLGVPPENQWGTKAGLALLGEIQKLSMQVNQITGGKLQESLVYSILGPRAIEVWEVCLPGRHVRGR